MATIACDSQSLVTAAKCLFPCIPPGMSRYVKLALLCAIANGTTMDCSSQNLVNQALCLQSCIPPGYTDAIEIYLLCQIASTGTGGGGGGGGTGGVTCGVADPVAAPANACTLYYRTDNGSLWAWNGAAWVNFIAA